MRGLFSLLGAQTNKGLQKRRFYTKWENCQF